MAFSVRWQVQSQLFPFTDSLYALCCCYCCCFSVFFFSKFILVIQHVDLSALKCLIVDFSIDILFLPDRNICRSGWSCNVITNTRSTRFFFFFLSVVSNVDWRETISNISNRFYYYSKSLNERFGNQEISTTIVVQLNFHFWPFRTFFVTEHSKRIPYFFLLIKWKEKNKKLTKKETWSKWEKNVSILLI